MMRPHRVPEWADTDPRRTPIALRRELIKLGYNDRALGRLKRTGVLAQPRRGAYVDGPTYAGLDEKGCYAVRTRTIMKQANTTVVASHVSSAVEYDAPTWGLDLGLTHLTRVDGEAGRKEAGVQQHCGKLIDGDVVSRNGIDMTSGTRTAIEVTTVADVEPSLIVVNHLLHHALTTEAALAERYTAEGAAMERWPHSLKTDLVLRLANPKIESAGETRTFMLCFRKHIPMPEPQVEISDPNGVVVARVDFAWPQFKVFLEFDGKIKYQRLLRPGETITDVVLREKRREELICRLTGWRCIRITWADLENPDATAAMIMRELMRQDAA
ncbi:type IV toxin-antitoxin system AbiEi family antitoxin domain-containing protein [Nocardioides plantarum]|uniref:Transcriptional regulator, AbiEi antitoxin, Type IV TA system n=1 Tax=Nocardioides plantarum TaxID=29299 RepID=A0ABV5KBV6_9ACTN|nr:type IV toxin-antitoxin system AbiEi family antitoxin domain-containing protein [Nocardioides plantarum]